MTIPNGNHPDSSDGFDASDGRKEVVKTGQPDRPPEKGGSGYTRGPAVPSLHDVAMADESTPALDGFNLAKELITGSRLPEEYLPRGVHNPKGIARRKRMVSKYNRVYRRRGSCMNDSIWIGDQMAIGINGAGREDAKEVAKAALAAGAQERAERRSGVLGMGRPRSNG